VVFGSRAGVMMDMDDEYDDDDNNWEDELKTLSAKFQAIRDETSAAGGSPRPGEAHIGCGE